MRISDWSSDVCSSDLRDHQGRAWARLRAPPSVRAGCLRRSCSLQPSSELQSAFTRGFRQRLDAAVEQKAAAIEHHLGDARLLGSRSDALADARRRVDIRTRLGARAFFERSEEHTSELQSLMRTSYAVSCLQKKN